MREAKVSCDPDRSVKDERKELNESFLSHVYTGRLFSQSRQQRRLRVIFAAYEDVERERGGGGWTQTPANTKIVKKLKFYSE